MAMQHPYRKMTIMFGVMTIVASFLFGVFVFSPWINSPTVLVNQSRLIETAVPQGGELRFEILASVSHTTCVGSITREFSRQIVDPDGVTVWEKHRTMNVGAPIAVDGETRYVIVAPLFPGMGPGRWRFVGETVWNCGFWRGGLRRYRTPVMMFEVLPRV